MLTELDNIPLPYQNFDETLMEDTNKWLQLVKGIEK